jgi:hypothetical protein
MMESPARLGRTPRTRESLVAKYFYFFLFYFYFYKRKGPAADQPGLEKKR